MKNFIFWAMVAYQVLFLAIAITHPEWFTAAFDMALEAMKPEACVLS